MYSPSLDQFLKLTQQGNMVPISRRLLSDTETPLSAYKKIRGRGESFLLESVEGGEHVGRYSFVGCNPRAVIRQCGERVEVLRDGAVTHSYKIAPAGQGIPGQVGGVPGRADKAAQGASGKRVPKGHVAGQVGGGNRQPDSSTGVDATIPTVAGSREDGLVRDGLEVVERVLSPFKAVAVPGLPRFTGGAVGFIGYEFIHDVEPVVPRPSEDELKTPVMYFMVADRLLIFDRAAQTLTVMVNAVVEEGESPEKAYTRATGEIEGLVRRLSEPAEHRPVTLPLEVEPLPTRSNVSREKFLSNVEKAKGYITSGDIIQVVGSQRFAAETKCSPLDIYRAARSVNPSPYMFLLELEGFSLVGASPEIHVRCEERVVEIRPIAGTRRRGVSEIEDKALEAELLADPKERAEHVMLVDLARNDLGRVCDYGSVRVKDLMIIERYSHVMHIVSQVEGRLSSDRTAYDLMRATFPAGTLSGAPKIRAMQIIAELEQTARGPYGGCVGYFSFNGNLDCCITIRTALIKDGMAYVQSGGGWVNDSVPAEEYQESVNKAQAMLKALALARSFGSQD